MSIVEVSRGDSPVLLAMPHTGTQVPPEIAASLNETGRALADTDWHVERLYDRLAPGATIVRATFHRYVIDANRDPAGTLLYPGQNTTGLAPLTDFDGQPIWREPPDADDIEARRAAFHAPYHAALAKEIARLKARHGVAVLYDCHSIRSRIPFLFDGELPVLNIGSNDGVSCAGAIERAAVDAAETSGFSFILNGRFKGGWTTRHYGRPADDIHAIQMEIAQRAYLSAETPPWAYDAARAEPLRASLAALLATIEELALAGDMT
jgi:formiminoglutamase